MTLRFYTQSSYPLNILLNLEWLLLAIAAIVTIYNHASSLLLMNCLGLIGLAGMGLYFPEKWLNKWLYTASEFAILLLVTFAGNFPLPSVLFVVMVIRNCVLFADEDLRQRSAITLILFITCLISQSLRLWNWRFMFAISFEQIGLVWIGLLMVFGLVILFLQLLVDAVMAQKRSQEQLRKYALQIEELATLQERNRIARDIHDSLGHSLTIFNIHLAAALRLLDCDPAEAKALLQEAKQIGKKSLQEVRESVMMLRSDPLQGKSLSEAIAKLISEFERTTGITPQYRFELSPAYLPEHLSKDLSENLSENLSDSHKSTIYRLVQESLTNIYKHSAASAVSISIQAILKDSVREIKVSIEDNGKGFDLSQSNSGFGLQGMKERILAIAGELTIKTAPNQGCKIYVNFPNI
jgi:signal transduction histidine kinase